MQTVGNLKEVLDLFGVTYSSRQPIVMKIYDVQNNILLKDEYCLGIEVDPKTKTLFLINKKSESL